MAPPVQEPILDDDDVGLDDDKNLPWPDVERIDALWRNHGSNFHVGQRYLLGKPITADSLQHTLTTAYQRQQHAAALELVLIHELENGGWGRNRTGVRGFAGRCMTTLPPSRYSG